MPRPRSADTGSDAAQPGGALPFLTVAIGASAGGLEAFTSFLRALPADTGMAFVLIQHLDPLHKSLLASLLSVHTAMPVVEAVDGMKLTPDMVFVIPPDATMTIKTGRLAIASPAPARINRHPIDICFASLAEDQRRAAVAIVLAGAGSDGSHGLSAIRQHGGMVLAQADDDGRPLAGMPYSAVTTGLVDHVLAVGAMPAQLLQYQRSLRDGVSPANSWGVAPTVDAQHFAELCLLLRDRTGHDFSQYKRPTLLRRIHRRMQLQHVATMPEFIELLRREPQQLDRLFHALLIHVTQFMRDPAAFQAVQANEMPRLLAGKGAADSVRIWVPGCATGEEVFSLAILLRELMDQQAAAPKVQIFGTDIDEDAIAVARAGRYSASALAQVAPEWRGKWFTAEGKAYSLVRAIREMCVFSVHNVIKDPPFSRLDMISCRNLLIYLGRDLQVQLLRNFHFALNPGGILFLGLSESVTHGAALFSPRDKRYRIFERHTQPGAVAGAPAGGPPSISRQRLHGLVQPATAIDDTIDRNARRALEQYAPAYAVIDRNYEIIRFSGGAIGRFMEPSAGVASLNLFGIMRRALRPAVRSAVQKIVAGQATVVDERLILPLDGRNHAIILVVKPVSDGRTERELYLVALQDTGPVRGRTRVLPPGSADAPDEAAGERNLAEELYATRAHLLTSISELESANEEMTSSNEEYQSTNEELQATNDELETAKEEMQSVNEELQTINAELVAKNDLLSKLNNDFQNLLDSTQIATLFLDRELLVTRFTPRVIELFRLRETDIGRPVTEIACRLDYTTLAADVEAVLTGLETVERELQLTRGEATFLMQIRPYRTLDKTVDGVVITFVDMSKPKRLLVEEALRNHNQTLELRVAERTTELEAANQALQQQTSERRHTEEMLRQSVTSWRTRNRRAKF